MGNNKSIDIGSIEYERINSIAKLTLSREKYHNSLTYEMYKQLEGLLDLLKDDETIKVLVIQGAGKKSFASGTDIKHFKGFTGKDGVDYENTISRIIKKLEIFPKPTIAAINGYAVGSGLIIATACDLRYATKKSSFGAPIAKTLGNCLSIDNYKRISRELGIMATKEMLYTGRLMPAEEAKSAGFVTDIFEEENFIKKTMGIAKTIEENAYSTVNATKTAFNRMLKTEGINSQQNFDDIIYDVYNSDYFSEGVQAHLEKRSPVWKK